MSASLLHILIFPFDSLR